MRWWWMVTGTLLCVACGGGERERAVDGDGAPRHGTGLPEEFPSPFTTIRSVMALPDGRLVLSDPQENRLVLLDFTDGSQSELGRLGEGPREYRRVGGLYRARGGGVLVFDQELRRLLPVAPSGTLEDAESPPHYGFSGSWSRYAPDHLSTDSLGYAYSAIREGDFTARAAVLLRHGPGARPDTLTRLRRRETRAVTGQGAREYQEVLFSPEDAWVVAPDGYVAVVRAEPYQLEWIPPIGQPRAGPRIRHEPVPITRTEKEAIASGQAGPRGRYTVTRVMVPAGGSPGGGRTTPTPMAVEELLWAGVKPPFDLRDGRWPVMDEHGRLWVARGIAQGAPTRVFDVFDRSGNLVDRVGLPAGSRLVGFDRKWLYTARADSADLEHLQRFPLPP